MGIGKILKEKYGRYCALHVLIILLMLFSGTIIGCGDGNDIAIRFKAEKLLSKADRLKDRLILNSDMPDDDFRNLIDSYEAVIKLADIPVENSAIEAGTPTQKQAWAIALLANTRIASLYFDRNEFNKAFEYYEKVVSSPVSDDMQKNVIMRYMALTKERAGDYKDAAAIYNLVAEGYVSIVDPEKPDMDALASPIKAAEMLLKQNGRKKFNESLDKARSYYKSLIVEYPRSKLEKVAWGKIAATYLRQNRYRRALEILESSGRDEQGRLTPATLMFMADINMDNLKDYDAAEKIYREFLENYPQINNRSRAVLGLGICLYEKGEYSEARKTLKGIENIAGVTEATAAQAFFLIAICYEAENNWAMASGQLDLVMATFPGSKESYDAALQKVNYFRGKGQKKMAKKAFESAVKYIEKYIDVNSAKPAAVAQAIGYLAKAYIENGNYETAIEKLSILHSQYSRTPDGALAPLKIADLYENVLNDPASAIEWLNTYIRETPLSADKEQVKQHVEELQNSLSRD